MSASVGVCESSPSALSLSLLLSESGGVGGMSAGTLRSWVFSSRVIAIGLIMKVVVGTEETKGRNVKTSAQWEGRSMKCMRE